MGDYLHFYLALGAIPLGLCILVANIFIGPAKLEPIPEGYVPKEHEYHRHPIARWFASVYPSYQQCYEIMLHRDWQLDKGRRQLQLREEVKRLMREDGDYAAY